MTETLVNGLQPFHAMEILKRARELEAAGRHICHMEVGEPGSPPAPEVQKAVADSLATPHRYTMSKGLPELRAGLVDYYREIHRADVDPEHIIVTTGSSAGFLLTFLGSFGAGARIAVTRPGYPAYFNILQGLNLEPVEIPLSAENGWRLDADIVRKTCRDQPFDGLLLASPANPTGAAVGRDALAAIIALCRDLGVTFISDEIYHGLEFGPPSASALELGDDMIVINSFSKFYCMTGWRIGWMVVPQQFLRRAELLQQNLFISAPSISQVAAIAALKARDYGDTQKQMYRQNRDAVDNALAAMGLAAAKPDGAFYAYVDVSRYTNNSMEFSKQLLEDAGVATTPGVDFDRVNGHRFLRLSFAGATADIEEGMSRMAAFVERSSGNTG